MYARALGDELPGPLPEVPVPESIDEGVDTRVKNTQPVENLSPDTASQLCQCLHTAEIVMERHGMVDYLVD